MSLIFAQICIYIQEDMDFYEVVTKVAIPVLETDTVKSLQARIQVKEYLLFPYAMHEVARRLLNGAN